RPDVPEGCVEVLRKAMHRDPNQRYQSGEEMAAGLAAIDFSEAPQTDSQSHEMEDWAELAAAAQQSGVVAASDEREPLMALPPPLPRTPPPPATRLPAMPTRAGSATPPSSGAKAPLTAAWTEAGGVKILARPIPQANGGKFGARPAPRGGQGGVPPV